MAKDVFCDFERVEPNLVLQAAGFQAAILADVGGRRGTMHGRITAVAPTMKLAGPALTVEVRPGDNLMVHAAMALAKPGDVLVIDGKADQTCALMGALMINACIQRGIAGVVVDAAVRDSLELTELDFPVFSVGTNPNGPTKLAPGRVGLSINCGGVSVHPGDLIVADADGVVVVERARVAELLPLASQKVTEEANRMVQIRGGNPKASWLNQSLITAGILKENESL